MSCRKLSTILFLCTLICVSSTSAQDAGDGFAPQDYPKVYQPSWDSLQRHQLAPEWLSDSKLGIYFHWGPYSVPAFKTEWYPRWIHMTNPKKWGAGSMEYHEEHYGPIEKFGYHHFIPMFTAEKFDPDEWGRVIPFGRSPIRGPCSPAS